MSIFLVICQILILIVKGSFCLFFGYLHLCIFIIQYNIIRLVSFTSLIVQPNYIFTLTILYFSFFLLIFHFFHLKKLHVQSRHQVPPQHAYWQFLRGNSFSHHFYPHHISIHEFNKPTDYDVMLQNIDMKKLNDYMSLHKHLRSKPKDFIVYNPSHWLPHSCLNDYFYKTKLFSVQFDYKHCNMVLQKPLLFLHHQVTTTF